MSVLRKQRTLKKIHDWIKDHQLIHRGDHVVVACSGGADSLALLDMLVKLQKEMHFFVSVAHFDHCLRGFESQKDAEFVSDYCQQRALPFYLGRADVAEERKRRGGSIEAIARELRYAFLQQLAARIGAARIATGHHRDDQAETVLLNLLRGSGGRGLGGIRTLQGNLIRPLLCLSRHEIELYCDAKGLAPRNDGSNSNIDFFRNRIRHELVPFLVKEYNPAIVETLCRTADILQAEHQFLRQSAIEKLRCLATSSDKGYCFCKEDFLFLEPALQRELIVVMLEALRRKSQGISYVHVEKIRSMIADERGSKQIMLPGRIKMRKVYNQIYLENSLQEPAPENGVCLSIKSVDSPGKTMLECPGKNVLPCFRMDIVCSFHKTPLPDDFGLSSIKVAFDFDKLSGPLQVRSRLPGDVFQPLGAMGHRKLKKMLIDLKVPLAERDSVPIITDQEGILWVGGLRRAERAKISASTLTCLVLELRPWSTEKM